MGGAMKIPFRYFGVNNKKDERGNLEGIRFSTVRDITGLNTLQIKAAIAEGKLLLAPKKDKQREAALIEQDSLELWMMENDVIPFDLDKLRPLEIVGTNQLVRFTGVSRAVLEREFWIPFEEAYDIHRRQGQKRGITVKLLKEEKVFNLLRPLFGSDPITTAITQEPVPVPVNGGEPSIAAVPAGADSGLEAEYNQFRRGGGFLAVCKPDGKIRMMREGYNKGVLTHSLEDYLDVMKKKGVVLVTVDLWEDMSRKFSAYGSCDDEVAF